MFKLNKFALAILSSVAVAACGGGGGGDDDNGGVNPAPDLTYTVKVQVDGSQTDYTVCVDADGNSSCDGEAVSGSAKSGSPVQLNWNTDAGAAQVIATDAAAASFYANPLGNCAGNPCDYGVIYLNSITNAQNLLGGPDQLSALAGTPAGTDFSKTPPGNSDLYGILLETYGAMGLDDYNAAGSLDLGTLIKNSYTYVQGALATKTKDEVIAGIEGNFSADSSQSPFRDPSGTEPVQPSPVVTPLPDGGFEFSIDASAESPVWKFSDGSELSGNTVTKTFDGAGTYTFEVTFKFNGRTVTKKGSVVVSEQGGGTVNHAPAINGTGIDETGACNEVHFKAYASDPDGDVLVFTWKFDDGDEALGEEVTHTFASSGDKSVNLTVSDGVNEDTRDVPFTVNGLQCAAPAPGITASFTVQEVAGKAGTFTFKNTSKGATKYSWDFGDGTTSADANPTHTYEHSGSYEVTLTASDDKGNSKTYSQSVTVTLPSDGGITASFTFEAVAGSDGTYQFTNTSEGAVKFAWDFGDGQTSTDENPKHTYAKSGSYKVTLTVTDADGNTSEPYAATVKVTLSEPGPGPVDPDALECTLSLG